MRTFHFFARLNFLLQPHSSVCHPKECVNVGNCVSLCATQQTTPSECSSKSLFQRISKYFEGQRPIYSRNYDCHETSIGEGLETARGNTRIDLNLHVDYGRFIEHFVQGMTSWHADSLARGFSSCTTQEIETTGSRLFGHTTLNIVYLVPNPQSLPSIHPLWMLHLAQNNPSKRVTVTVNSGDMKSLESATILGEEYKHLRDLNTTVPAGYRHYSHPLSWCCSYAFI